MAATGALRHRSVVAAVAAALLGGGVIAGPTAGAATPPQVAPGVSHEVYFNDPGAPARAPEFKDYALHDRIVRMIKATPQGAAIRGAIYSISTESVADALIDARKRGVDVKLVFGGQASITSGQPLRLKNALGADLVRCDTHTSTGGHIHACVSKRSGSTMHSKFFTFSRTGTKTNVVAVTSTNWSGAQSAQYNDMLVTSGDAQHYGGYVKYFDDLFAMRKNNNYADSANGTVRAPGALAYTRFSPKASASGSTKEEAATDLVAQDLAQVSRGPDCSVRASQRYFDGDRDPIVDQVVRLASGGGCKVEILYNSLPSAARDKMRAAGATLKRVHVYHPAMGYETKIHHKYYIVKGTVAGASTSYVATGTHNFTGSALRANDEILVQVSDPAVVDAYDQNFALIWGRTS